MNLAKNVHFVRRPAEDGQEGSPTYDVLAGDVRIGQVTRSSELTYYRWSGISVVRAGPAGGRRKARRVYETSRSAAAAALLRVYLDQP